MSRDQQRRLPTLKVFIEQGIAQGKINFPRNSHVSAYGFASMYVRMTKRWIEGDLFEPVLDLAAIEARHPGQGSFTKLIPKLRQEYPALNIFVEQTHERFGAHLLKMGFSKLDPQVHGESYFLVSANFERQLKDISDTLDKCSNLIADTMSKLEQINQMMKEGV